MWSCYIPACKLILYFHRVILSEEMNSVIFLMQPAIDSTLSDQEKNPPHKKSSYKILKKSLLLSEANDPEAI